MAIRKPGLIALFDVDGTLTAPRKVPIFFPDSFCLLILFHCIVFMIMVSAAQDICKRVVVSQIYCIKVTFPCIGLKLSLMQCFSTQMLGGHSKDVRIHAGTTKGNCLAIIGDFMDSFSSYSLLPTLKRHLIRDISGCRL